MTEYVDKLFASYKEHWPRNCPRRMTCKQWLGGSPEWRKLLRMLGAYAELVSKHANIRDARTMWRRIDPEAKGCLVMIPLLDQTAHRARSNDKVFWQFMKDLATLAKL